MAKILSNPTVRVNNVILAPKPNSVSVITGKGEKTVKGISAGGGNVDIAVSDNVETRVGKVKFSLPDTTENLELIRGWQSIDLNIGNIISVTEDDFHAVITGAVVINDPESVFGVDEYVEVEFNGRPSI